MGNVLSRSETEALLSALNISPGASTSEANDQHPIEQSIPAVASPNSRELLHLESCQHAFAAASSGAMSSLANTEATIKLKSVSTRDELATTELEMVRRSSELESNITFRVDDAVAIALIDSALGSGVKATPRDASTFTDIETRLFERVVDTLAECFDQSWDSPVRERSSPQTQVSINSWDTTVVTSFDIRVGDCSATLEVAIAAQALQQRLGKLNSCAKKAVDDRQSESSNEVVDSTLLSVELKCDDLQLTERDDLEVGSLIRTGASVKDGFRVLQDGRQRFIASVGKIGDRKAIQITGIDDLESSADSDQFCNTILD